MTKYAVGQKIYYTGDMANHSGWFKITGFKEAGPYNPNMYALTEINGDRVFGGVYEIGISDKYNGHCGTRFVTEEAYKAYREEQQKQLEVWLNKNAVKA